MQISDILSTLNYSYYPCNDEIIITWFDKESVSNCLGTLPEDEDVLDEAWNRASQKIQNTLDNWIEAHQIQESFAEILKEEIADVEKEWNEDE